MSIRSRSGGSARSRTSTRGGSPVRRLAVLGGGAAATALALTASLLPAQATTAPAVPAPSYVALGDSYSSGTGTRTYLDDGTDCLRSVSAYPSLIASARGYSLNFRACSGAVIDDVASNQVNALSSSTGFVSISVGGNDAGFADVITECAKPGWLSRCNAKIDQAQAFISNTLPGRLGALYASIRSRAPQAKVVVVGYPRLFNGDDCNALTFFSPAEEARLNATADLLNSKLSARASAAGFRFANPTSRFLGHAVCDSPEWINGLSWPIVESFHPNKAGHAQGYTPTVSPVLTGARVTVTRRTRTAARASADELAAVQRKYAAEDRRIRPAKVRVPDYRSPAVRRAAERAGIDYDRWLARHGLD